MDSCSRLSLRSTGGLGWARASWARAQDRPLRKGCGSHFVAEAGHAKRGAAIRPAVERGLLRGECILLFCRHGPRRKSTEWNQACETASYSRTRETVRSVRGGKSAQTQGPPHEAPRAPTASPTIFDALVCLWPHPPSGPPTRLTRPIASPSPYLVPTAWAPTAQHKLPLCTLAHMLLTRRRGANAAHTQNGTAYPLPTHEVLTQVHTHKHKPHGANTPAPSSPK